MINLLYLIILCLFLNLGSAYAGHLNSIKHDLNSYGGIDFTYSSPEIFFAEPEILKLSVVWEILNCYYWENGIHDNQCNNLEFYIVSPTPNGDFAFTSVLEGSQCLTGGCEAIAKLPLIVLLTPLEYEKYQLGVIVIKELRLHLAFGGEEDDLGRIVGRSLALPYYDLKIILNGTEFQSVSVIRIERALSISK